jgi:hypothetical protein
MKLRYSIVVYLGGIMVDVFGVLFKILHLPGADEILILGALAQTVGLCLIIFKILTHPKLKDFLDW